VPVTDGTAFVVADANNNRFVPLSAALVESAEFVSLILVSELATTFVAVLVSTATKFVVATELVPFKAVLICEMEFVTAFVTVVVVLVPATGSALFVPLTAVVTLCRACCQLSCWC